MLVAVEVPAVEPVGVEVRGPVLEPGGVGGVGVDGGRPPVGRPPGGERVVQRGGGAPGGPGAVVGAEGVDVAAGRLLVVQAVRVVHHLRTEENSQKAIAASSATGLPLRGCHLVVEGGSCPARPVAGVGPPVRADGLAGGGAGADVVVDDGQGAVEGHHAVVAGVGEVGAGAATAGGSGRGPGRRRQEKNKKK